MKRNQSDGIEFKKSSSIQVEESVIGFWQSVHVHLFDIQSLLSVYLD